MLKIYAIEFEMRNCGEGVANGALFLSEFLGPLNKMDKASSVLPVFSNSDNEDDKIDSTTVFPDDTSEDQSKATGSKGGANVYG